MTAPLTIGAGNSVAVVGMSWLWVRRFAAAHGVPIYQVGLRKQLVPADALLAAIASTVAAAPPPRELTDEEERAKILASLGLERRP